MFSRLDIRDDETLLTLLCLARLGSAAERCEAAEHLKILRDDSDIHEEDIHEHLYLGHFLCAFKPLLQGARNLTGESVFDVIDRMSVRYRPHWEAALEIEYGASILRDGRGKWCPSK
eukprot:12431507-Karenia_brevis.AAC.1